MCPGEFEFMEWRWRTMLNGTVRWFNRTIGAGFIRTDDGENVMFLNHAIKDFDPQGMKEGLRVSLDIQESRDGYTAVRVMTLK
jgi:cold shock CspA family protein